MQQKRLLHPTGRPGFTLIELLVVIVIIGLLTTMAIASYTSAQRRSRDSVRKAAVNTVSTAAESYYAAKQKFPGKYNVKPGVEQNQSLYANCERSETIAGIQYFTYYYAPLDPSGTGIGAPCNKRAANTDQTGASIQFTPTDYLPYPSWIPGIGEYLSSIPTEPRYVAGNAAGNYVEILEPMAGGVVNPMQTLVYRKLNGGYAAYAKLENPDSEAQSSLSNLLTDPRLPSTYESSVAAAKDIYMVRR